MTTNRRVLAVIKIALTIVLVSLIIFGGVIITRGTVASANTGSKIYTPVKITDGDSLWNIASKYCSDSETIDSYIDEVCRINDINEMQDIISGNYLTVYYYK